MLSFTRVMSVFFILVLDHAVFYTCNVRVLFFVTWESDENMLPISQDVNEK